MTPRCGACGSAASDCTTAPPVPPSPRPASPAWPPAGSPLRDVLPVTLLGTVLMAHDWHDRARWFERGYQD